MTALLMPFICVLSRTILTLIDRNLLGLQGKGVQKQLWLNSLLPLLIALPFIHPFSLIHTMLTKECLLSAIILHLVSLAFSYSFKSCSIREVVISAKVVDLLLMPALVFFLFATQNSSEWRMLPYAIAFISSIPLFVGKKDFRFLLLPSSLFLIGILSLQLLLGDLIKSSQATSLEEGWNMVVSILCLRTLFSSITLLFLKKEPTKDQTSKNNSYGYYGILFARALFMLISYVTLIYSLQMDNVFIVLPILNSGALLSVCLARVILKEKCTTSDLIALIGLSCSTFV